MFERLDTPDTPDLLLRFTPHTPRRNHTTGWTPERQIAFIAALARTGVVTAAAQSVGMSARSAYQLRDRVRARYSNWADAPMTPERAELLGPGYIYSFAAAWDLALARGLKFQIEAAAPVALEGEQEPVIRRGRIIGWRTRFNTRLAINALGAFRRYNEGRSYDHEIRTAERTEHLADKIERLLRIGPIPWSDPPPPETVDERRARRRRARAERRIYGPRGAGLLDPDRPADSPPRTLAQRAAEACAARVRPPESPPTDPDLPRIRPL